MADPVSPWPTARLIDEDGNYFYPSSSGGGGGDGITQAAADNRYARQDLDIIPGSGTGGGVNVTTNFINAFAPGAPQVDFTEDSDFDLAGGATLRATGVGPGQIAVREYPFGGSNNPLDKVTVAMDFTASTSFVGFGLFRPDGTLVPITTTTVPDGWDNGSGSDSNTISFFGSGPTMLTVDLVLAIPEVFAEGDITFGIIGASEAAGDPPTVNNLTVSWTCASIDATNRFIAHLIAAIRAGEVPVGVFFAKFGPFGDINMNATGDGSYAKTVGDMTDNRGGTHWTVADLDGFWMYNQSSENAGTYGHNGRYTFHRPGSGDCYFTYDAIQPSLDGTIVVLEQGGDPIAGLDPAAEEQGGTVPGTGLEQQVLYYIRHVTLNEDGTIAGFNLNQLLPNPTLMFTTLTAGDYNFSDSEMIRFMDTTDGGVVCHLRAADFSDGANVRQRIYYFWAKAGTSNSAIIDTHPVDGITPLVVSGGGGVAIYSDGTNWRLLSRWGRDVLTPVAGDTTEFYLPNGNMDVYPNSEAAQGNVHLPDAASQHPGDEIRFIDTATTGMTLIVNAEGQPNYDLYGGSGLTFVFRAIDSLWHGSVETSISPYVD